MSPFKATDHSYVLFSVLQDEFVDGPGDGVFLDGRDGATGETFTAFCVHLPECKPSRLAFALKWPEVAVSTEPSVVDLYVSLTYTPTAPPSIGLRCPSTITNAHRSRSILTNRRRSRPRCRWSHAVCVRRPHQPEAVVQVVGIVRHVNCSAVGGGEYPSRCSKTASIACPSHRA